MREIRFTPPFQKRFKKLKKRYRHIKKDIQPLLMKLQEGELIGNQMTGVSQTVFKARAKNSDIPTGKSGGYRLIYQVINNQIVLLLVIYAKSDQTNVTSSEIEEIIKDTLEQ